MGFIRNFLAKSKLRTMPRETEEEIITRGKLILIEEITSRLYSICLDRTMGGKRIKDHIPFYAPVEKRHIEEEVELYRRENSNKSAIYGLRGLGKENWGIEVTGQYAAIEALNRMFLKSVIQREHPNP